MRKKIVVIGTNEIAERTIISLIRKDMPIHLDFILIGRNLDNAQFVAESLNDEIEEEIGSDSESDSESHCCKNIKKTPPHVRVGEKLSDFANADVIAITAGDSGPVGEFQDRYAELPFSCQIISQYASTIKQYAPQAFVATVTNPLDIFTWHLLEALQFSPHKVIGVGASLDSARYTRIIKEELRKNGIPVSSCSAYSIGPHSGNRMVLLAGSILVNRKPILDLVSSGRLTLENLKTILINAERETYAAGFKIANARTSAREPYEAALEMLIYILKKDKKFVDNLHTVTNNINPDLDDYKEFIEFCANLFPASEMMMQIPASTNKEIQKHRFWTSYILALAGHHDKTKNKNIIFGFSPHILLFCMENMDGLSDTKRQEFFDLIGIKQPQDSAKKILNSLSIGKFRTARFGPGGCLSSAIYHYLNSPPNTGRIMPASIYLPKNNTAGYPVDEVCTGVLTRIDQHGATPIPITMTEEEKNKFIITANELKQAKEEYGSLTELCKTGGVLREKLSTTEDSVKRKSVFFEEMENHKQRVKSRNFALPLQQPKKTYSTMTSRLTLFPKSNISSQAINIAWRMIFKK